MEKIDQPTPAFCPYLGLLSDPETSFSYPSLAHHCFHCKTPSVPLLQHQQNYCLGIAHPSCPVFAQAPTEIFLAEYQAKKQSAPNSRRKLFSLLGLFLLLGFLLLLGWPAISERVVAIDQTPSSFVSQPSISPTKTFQPTLTQAPLSATPTLTKLPTLTATPTPTATPSRHEMEIPIQAGSIKILIHRILPGETLQKLVKNYTTTVDVINHINYHLPSPLWADSIIVLMPEVTTADPSLPAFEPYQVTDTKISIEDLAKKLQVEANILKYYNGCVNGCQLVAKNWVLIPHSDPPTIGGG